MSALGALMLVFGLQHLNAIHLDLQFNNLLLQTSLEPSSRTLINIPKPDKQITREAKMDASQVISSHGYPAETHTATTEDGYGLVMYRIPHGKVAVDDNNKTRMPVLLMHGMNCQAFQWIDNGQDSFAFAAADAGYDVWLGNLRGTRVSNHTKYSRKNKHYWDFCLDDHVNQDVPKMIDKILNVTGQPKLIYGGQSLGTIVGFAVLASKPEYNEKVAGVVAINPVWVPRYVTSYIAIVLHHMKMFKFVNTISMNHFVMAQSPLMQSLVLRVCPSSNPMICSASISVGSGFDPLRNQARVPLFSSHCSSGASVKLLVQFMQWFNQNRAAMFDYGRKKNILKYNSVEAPAYNISHVTAPVALFFAANDPAATPVDVALIRRHLPNIIGFEQFSSTMATHGTFMWHLNNSKELFYDEVLNYFSKIQQL